MEVVNPFILKNKERMVVFLDQLSSVQDPGNSPPNSNNNYDIGKFHDNNMMSIIRYSYMIIKITHTTG